MKLRGVGPTTASALIASFFLTQKHTTKIIINNELPS